MNPEDTSRINLIRFPLIVGVVFIHAYSTVAQFNNGASSLGFNQSDFFSLFFRNLISEEIARVAVPTFFLISGYLFFLGLNWSKTAFIKKLKSRLHTLLIPFLIWNIGCLLVIGIGQYLPSTQVYFSGKNPQIFNFSFYDYIKHLLGLGVNPIAYQFWFIRDLMLLCILSPIILTFNKTLPFVFNIGLLYLWLTSQWPIFSPSAEPMLFFSLGSLLATRNCSLFVADRYGKTLLSIFLILVFVNILFCERNITLHQISMLFGVASTLYITKFFIHSKLKLPLLSLSNASFFVYAAHEPLLSLTRKIAYKLIEPQSDIMILGLYFLMPITVIVFLLYLFRLLKTMLPEFLRIITGGRAIEQ